MYTGGVPCFFAVVFLAPPPLPPPGVGSPLPPKLRAKRLRGRIFAILTVKLGKGDVAKEDDSKIKRGPHSIPLRSNPPHHNTKYAPVMYVASSLYFFPDLIPPLPQLQFSRPFLAEDAPLFVLDSPLRLLCR